MSAFDGEGAAPQRQRMVFKPRDPEAAAALERERLQKTKSNPFGDAKPREAVIALREGKDEKEVLKQASAQYELKLRLNGEQIEAKRTAEERLLSARHELDDEEDEDRKAVLQADVDAQESALADMLKQFESMIVEQAKKGIAPRPSERRAAREAADGVAGGGGGFQEGRGGFPNRTGHEGRAQYDGFQTSGGGGGDFNRGGMQERRTRGPEGGRGEARGGGWGGSGGYAPSQDSGNNGFGDGYGSSNRRNQGGRDWNGGDGSGQQGASDRY